MAKEARYAEFLFQLADLGSELEIPKLRECARQILKIMPTGMSSSLSIVWLWKIRGHLKIHGAILLLMQSARISLRVAHTVVYDRLWKKKNMWIIYSFTFKITFTYEICCIFTFNFYIFVMLITKHVIHSPSLYIGYHLVAYLVFPTQPSVYKSKSVAM